MSEPLSVSTAKVRIAWANLWLDVAALLKKKYTPMHRQASRAVRQWENRDESCPCGDGR